MENEEVLEDNVAVLLDVSGMCYRALIAHDMLARELREAILRPSRTLAGETFTRKLNPAQAAQARDNFILAIYDRAFRWVVDKINQLLKNAGDKSKDTNIPYIGVLDISGFATKEGGFFAFCNNLLNEKLQQVYNSEIIGKRLEMMVEQIQAEVLFTALENLISPARCLFAKREANHRLDDHHLAHFRRPSLA